MQRKALGLGMGLSALLPSSRNTDGEQIISVGRNNKQENDVTIPVGIVPTEIDIETIVPNRYQPRQTFDQARLEELAKSIKSHGLLQPIIVRPTAPTGYELIAGERRLRASKLAGLLKIPAIIRDEINDHAMMEYAILENVQREELNAIERARAYARLMNEFAMTQEMIAEKIGIDRSSVANTVRLLNLPEPLWEAIADGSISMGHAKVLLSVVGRDLQLQLANEIKAKSLSVRQLEMLVKPVSGKKRASRTVLSGGISPDIRALENRIQHALGTKVRVSPSSGGKGEIRIEYYSLDDLDRILEKIT